MTIKGSCMCGEIEIQFSDEPALRALCHCTDCQKWSGSSFTANVAIPKANFSILKGTPKAWDAVGNSGKINKHFFCPGCGSSIYNELELMPDMTFVKAGVLEGGAASLDGKVDVEFFCKDRPSYQQAVLGAKQEPAFGQ